MRRGLVMAAAGLVLAGPAMAHVTYIPIFIPGGAAGPPPFAIGDASNGKDALTSAYKTFMKCDGFGRPDRKSDELNEVMHDAMFDKGVHPQLRYPVLPEPGAPAAEACTAALADPVVTADFPMRRAHLLLYRAMHRAVGFDSAGANADLDAVGTTLGPLATDAAAARSIGMDVRLLRAYAAFQAHDRQTARQLYLDVLAARPESDALINLAPVFYDWADSLPSGENLVQAMAREDPRWRQFLFLKAGIDGDFQRMVDIAPLLSDSYLEERNIRFVADLAGYTAYALTALGRNADADAEIRRARDFVAAHTPEPMPPVPDGVKEGRRDAQTRVQTTFARALGLAATGDLDRWAGWIALRRSAGTDPKIDFNTLVRPTESAMTPLTVRADLLRLARAKTPGVGNYTLLDTVKDKGWSMLITNGPSDQARLMGALFHPETYRLVPQGTWQGPDFAGFHWANPGQCGHLANLEGVVTWRCHHEVNTPAVVAEEVLLDAALDAHRHGKTGLVIRSRSTIRHMAGSLHDGYEVVMAIDAIDAANPPAAYRAVPWAILPTDQVLARLMAFYGRQAPAG